MLDSIKAWFRDHFSHPDAVRIVLVLFIVSTIIFFFGGMLAPVIAAVIIAYMLEGLVQYLVKQNVSRFLSVVLSFIIFMTLTLFVLLRIVPVITEQVSSFLQEIPRIIDQGKQLLVDFQNEYPTVLSRDQIDGLSLSLMSEFTSLGQRALSISLASIPVIITIIIYLFLVPLLIFFFLKDKFLLLGWLNSFLPTEKKVLRNVWIDVDKQIGNYIRGKFYEVVIVGTATYIAFEFMGVSYAPLLGFLVGFSVIVPYIGAAIVTFPVLIAAYHQFGFGAEFSWVVGVYALIQALDGNLLVPLLFSDVVNLHPVAIIVAVLIFGGVWGFWGVFFAIPLATLIKSVLAAWPTYQSISEATE